MSSSTFHGPSTSSAVSLGEASIDDAGIYRVCSTALLVCFACGSCLMVLTVAVWCWRAFTVAAWGVRRSASMAVAANGTTRCGLAPSTIAALPELAYHRGAGAGTGWAQCPICLAVVRDGETVRLLPACGHLFHVNCIDLWLHSHATCPLCRRDVR